MKNEIKILLVDDEADFRQLMSFWLKSKGYSVETAADGNAAIKMLQEKIPDIVFLDLNMPVVDGLGVLKKIRELDKNLPVIVISAYINDPRAKEAMSYGISGVFYKRKNFEEGLSLLETALRTHKRLKRD
ncbi:MAG: hypothetical protein COS99_02095 [Candidatus Omnitrophica bacterium CG07_land_8_20_14_0_80_42_15]|uniref:Response regulatory domain-containing protein n=1 Tax=Candidatus Aquitaenariimonas noxiae TaxID=1974741 RepID=A0A2J0KUB5_9BACT|nr:MAG: hypothetical protein COS99_02095 [Candidatus Omnitrophica bacterium CG07_land_8_20_14_0_80_42_15]